MMHKNNAWTWSLLAYLIVVRDSVGSEPSPNPFKTEDTHLTAKEGSCVTIHCSVLYPVDQKRTLDWFWIKNAEWTDASKNFTGTVMYSNTQIHPVTQDLAGRVSYIGSDVFRSGSRCDILISNLQKADSGNYAFRFVGKVNKWITKPEVNLTVQDNPCQISFQSSPVMMEEFDMVSVQCYTSSSCPDPELKGLNPTITLKTENGSNYKNITAQFQVNWKDDGRVLSCHPQDKDNMEDKCLARYISLKVEYAPKGTTAHVRSMDIKEKDDVTLTCSSRGHPNSTFSWFKAGQKATEGTNWRFYNIEPSQSGEYHCQAQNKHGSDNSSILNIDVKYAPVGVEIKTTAEVCMTKTDKCLLNEGDGITLTCEVKKSNPKPVTYIWYKNKMVTDYQQRRELRNIQSKNSGNYTCEAVNSVGKTKSLPIQIDVQYRPKDTRMNVDPSNTVKVNNPLTFTCKTDANPAPLYYSWYRISEHNHVDWMVNERDKTIKLMHVQISDHGCYMCSATNPVGTGRNSSRVSIRVLYGPNKPELSMVSVVREGDRLIINCTVQSFPVSELTLSGISKSKPHTPIRLLPPNYGPYMPNLLQVSFNVTLSHAGLYTCNAKNSEGSDKTEKELVVTYSPKNVTVLAHPGTIVTENGQLVLTVTENGQLVLSCIAQSNPPATSFAWEKTTPGKNETMGQVQNTTIQSLTPSHSGWYSCTANNVLGAGKSLEVEVKVRYAPKHAAIISSSLQPGGSGSVVLSCSSYSFPPILQYKWYWTVKGKFVDKFVSEDQNLTVPPTQPGTYYCVALNEIAAKKSDMVDLFLDRNFMKAMPFVLSFLLLLVVVLLICLVYRHNRNKSVQQGTSNTIPCWSSLIFLGQWNGTRENLVSETGVAESHRSREDLSTGDPYQRPHYRPGRPRPDNMQCNNIHTVYSTVNLPFGKQTPSPQQPIRDGDGDTQDDAVNYAFLNFGNEEKNTPELKAKAGEDGLYAKVAQPHKKDEKKGLEDYENIKGACPPKYPRQTNSDTETSEEDIELNYSEVRFKAKPENQRAHRHRNRGYGSPDDDYKTRFPEANI